MTQDAKGRGPWCVSLHGGHSGDYCEHAEGTLRDVLNAAVDFGFETYGISEHAPRLDPRYLFDSEVEKGWDVAKLETVFEAYADYSKELVEEFAPKLAVLRGFEIEVLPPDDYGEIMTGYRHRYDFDYMVGSVHFLEEVPIDGPLPLFEEAVKGYGSLERLGIAYYEKVREMVEVLRPEVVAHLDLIRLNAPSNEAVETPAFRKAATETLEVIKANNAILDLNTAGYRKGLGAPYPAPWLVDAAHQMGIPFCLGDDSHGPRQVGEGIEAGRAYLLDNGVSEITVLARDGDKALHRKVVPLH